jgi:hypothetical protein
MPGNFLCLLLGYGLGHDIIPGEAMRAWVHKNLRSRLAHTVVNEKKKSFLRRISQAGREGFEPSVEFYPDNHLAGGPNRPLWHLPSTAIIPLSGGGRGIRTPGGLPHTCFQDRHHSPLGHPSDTAWWISILSYSYPAGKILNRLLRARRKSRASRHRHPRRVG